MKPMEYKSRSKSSKLFDQLKWMDANTLQGQKQPKGYDSEPTRVYRKKFVYRNIPFDFDVSVWRDGKGRIIRDARAEFDWFRGAFNFAMCLRGEMTGEANQCFMYEVYENLPRDKIKWKNLKEAARAELDKTVKDIDWYLDESVHDLPLESFRFIQRIKKLKKPMPGERQRLEQIRGFERKAIEIWDRKKSKKDSAIMGFSYRGVPFVVAIYKDVWDKSPERPQRELVLASVPGLEKDKILGLRFGHEIYERIYGRIRSEILFDRNVPLQEKITYGVGYVTGFIDWFLGCPEADVLSETAVILAEMNKIVKSCPARLTCSRM